MCLSVSVDPWFDSCARIRMDAMSSPEHPFRWFVLALSTIDSMYRSLFSVSFNSSCSRGTNLPKMLPKTGMDRTIITSGKLRTFQLIISAICWNIAMRHRYFSSKIDLVEKYSAKVNFRRKLFSTKPILFFGVSTKNFRRREF